MIDVRGQATDDGIGCSCFRIHSVGSAAILPAVARAFCPRGWRREAATKAAGTAVLGGAYSSIQRWE
jgi:hypothetical protein